MFYFFFCFNLQTMMFGLCNLIVLQTSFIVSSSPQCGFFLLLLHSTCFSVYKSERAERYESRSKMPVNTMRTMMRWWCLGVILLFSFMRLPIANLSRRPTNFSNDDSRGIYVVCFNSLSAALRWRALKLWYGRLGSAHCWKMRFVQLWTEIRFFNQEKLIISSNLNLF